MMTVSAIHGQRICIVSHKPFADVLAGIEAALGHPDIPKFRRDLAMSQTEADLSRIVENAIGRSGFMEFARFDLGEVVRKTTRNHNRKILRILAGNPLVMKELVPLVPDAGSYAPVTILIDERRDGVYLSYDRMESLIAAFGNDEALRVARDLDRKVEQMLSSAAE
jgi:uncharacterized protein (DUF302 family)